MTSQTDLDRAYITSWAYRIVQHTGLPELEAMSRPHRELHIATLLKALGAEPREIAAVARHVDSIIRDNAAPADAPPRATGSARMFR